MIARDRKRWWKGFVEFSQSLREILNIHVSVGFEFVLMLLESSVGTLDSNFGIYMILWLLFF